VPVSSVEESRNASHIFLYFTYNHSMHTIKISGNQNPTTIPDVSPTTPDVSPTTLPVILPIDLPQNFSNVLPVVFGGLVVVVMFLGRRRFGGGGSLFWRKKKVFSLTVLGLSAVVFMGSFQLLQPTTPVNMIHCSGTIYSQDGGSVGGLGLAGDFSLVDLGGDVFSLSDFRGRVVVVDFMSVMCGECRRQFPHLGDVWVDGGYGDDVVLITVEVDPMVSLESFMGLREEFSYASWVWAMDTVEERVAVSYGVVSIPQVVVVDRDGFIRFRHVGETSASVLFEELDYLVSLDASDGSVGPGFGGVVVGGGGFGLSGLALIFSAGVLALLSPCGFPMLPGYISYYIGSEVSVERAVFGGVVCALGLVAVFSVIGVGVSLVGSFVSSFIPVLGLVAGLIAVFMGVSMLVKFKFPSFLGVSRAPSRRGLGGIFLYGCAYGLATLGCSAPIFFSTIFYAVASGGFVFGVLTFVVYALGMGVPIVVVSVLVSRAKRFVVDRVLRFMPWFERVGGVFLVVVGVYLLVSYYLHNLI
jgi:cytochrome c biogenesis protein CcdA/cytochrome oxidase Cu insertion factor (SCO1/SenC/PrrC family)